MAQVDLKTAEAAIPGDVRRSLVVAGVCIALVVVIWRLPAEWTLRLGEQLSTWMRLG